MQAPIDPNDPNAIQQKLLQALAGQSAPPPAARWNGGPLDPTTGLPVGTNPPQNTGSTTETPKVEGPAVTPPAGSSGAGSGTYDTTGLDPNNPIDAVFIKNQYKQNGVGSGFGDLQYWRAHPDQAARLSADQQGTGTDMPGPGDVGNTSRDPNYGKSTGSNPAVGFNPLSLLGGAQSQAAQDPADTVFARILQALTQYGG